MIATPQGTAGKKKMEEGGVGGEVEGERKRDRNEWEAREGRGGGRAGR